MTESATTPAPDFKLFFESLPALCAVITPDFKFVAASDAYLSATMTRRDAILGKGLFEVFPDNPNDPSADGAQNLKSSLNKVIAQKAPHTLPIQKYDIRRPGKENDSFEERYWSTTISPVLGLGQEVLYLIIRAEDITQHRHEIQIREERYHSLVDSVQDYAIMLLDKEGRISSWNQGAQRDIQWIIGPLPQIQADPTLFRQVWTNLISNAVKYTQPCPQARIEIGAQARDNAEETIFFIKDNGVGFDMKYAPKLFGVFQRLHSVEEFEGTGIGLANVLRIVQRHGGKTWAEGVLNQGATFYFSLPRS